MSQSFANASYCMFMSTHWSALSNPYLHAEYSDIVFKHTKNLFFSFAMLFIRLFIILYVIDVTAEHLEFVMNLNFQSNLGF